MAKLRKYLGDHSRAVDLMLDSADHSPTWVAAVLGKYVNGTQEAVFAGIPPDRWPAVLADSLMEYATDGKPYGNRIFDGYVRKSAASERGGGLTLAATGTDGRRNSRGAPSPPRDFNEGAERGQRFDPE